MDDGGEVKEIARADDARLKLLAEAQLLRAGQGAVRGAEQFQGDPHDTEQRGDGENLPGDDDGVERAAGDPGGLVRGAGLEGDAPAQDVVRLDPARQGRDALGRDVDADVVLDVRGDLGEQQPGGAEDDDLPGNAERQGRVLFQGRDLLQALTGRYGPNDAWVNVDLSTWYLINFCMLMLASFRAAESLRQTAMLDPLTGTLNRRGLFARLDPELEQHVTGRFPDPAGVQFFARGVAGGGEEELVFGILQELLVACLVRETREDGDELTFADVSHRAIESLRLTVDKVNWFSTYRVHHRVADRFRRGRVFLLGDAAHIVPPTGAKGLNLAASDVNYLWRILREYYHHGRIDLLASYSRLALDRVWKGERFSWFMTRLLHDFPQQSEFDRKMQAADRRYYLESRAGLTTIAENYVGLPMERVA